MAHKESKVALRFSPVPVRFPRMATARAVRGIPRGAPTFRALRVSDGAVETLISGNFRALGPPVSTSRSETSSSSSKWRSKFRAQPARVSNFCWWLTRLRFCRRVSWPLKRYRLRPTTAPQAWATLLPPASSDVNQRRARRLRMSGTRQERPTVEAPHNSSSSQRLCPRGHLHFAAGRLMASVQSRDL